MSGPDPLPFRATMDAYLHEAEALLSAVRLGDEAAAWRFKWMHPAFRSKSLAEVRAATLELTDAQAVVARKYAFESWTELTAFSDAVGRDGTEARFEAAVDALVSGDVETLRAMLRDHPELVRARSTRRHRATLLHYVAANGVEGGRQKTPANVVELAKILLQAGAEVDALAEMYETRCTTMSLSLSSARLAEAGLQGTLAETLIDFGAALEGGDSELPTALLTALAFGYRSTAETLARRGAPIDNVAAAAGLGRLEEAARLLPAADSRSRHVALALAVQHGHAQVVRLLIDAGEDPDRYNPDGYHSHSTPLHQAVWYNHAEVVRLLVERGARLDIPDTVYQGNPLDWAIHGERMEMAEFLRARGAPESS
jgi:ankyrin repeat protein